MTTADQSRSVYQRAAQAALAANPIEQLRLTVISPSMWPLLRLGDVIVVDALDLATVAVGDILVVRRGADLITHRLIDCTGDQWLMRGDNAVFADAPVARTACLGRVVAIEGHGRSIDLAAPRRVRLSRRLGKLGRAQWRIQHRLHLMPGASPLSGRLAQLIGLPLRVLSHVIAGQVRAD